MKTILANTISTQALREDRNCGCEEMIVRCGNNTGNVCFADALFSQLGNPDEVDCCDIADYHGEAVFALPAANWINTSGWALQKVFLPLRDKDVRIVAIGLGIQGKMGETAADIVNRLSEDSILALKILSEHSISIGVRGELTASVLEQLGIYNCKVIGCPSFYEPYRSGIEMEMNYDAVDMDRIVCGMTPGIQGAHRVLELAYTARNHLIFQAMVDMPLTMVEDRDIEQKHVDERFPGLRLSLDELKMYIKFGGGGILYTKKLVGVFKRAENFICMGVSFSWKYDGFF